LGFSLVGDAMTERGEQMTDHALGSRLHEEVGAQDAPATPAPPDASLQTRDRSPTKSLAELSPGLVSWMIRHRISLACTASRAGSLLLIGSRSDGSPGFGRAQFPGARGLAAFSHRIYLADNTSIWRLENTLRSREVVQEQYDRLFVPRNAQITGDIGAHELAVEPSGRVIVVATKYSCLATVSSTHAFKPLWKPAFVSKLAPEDRCHLNGLGMEDGRVRYVTSCSTADVVDGWRDHRESGGVLIDLADDRVIADGLSMPHSPRRHRGAAWFLHSGSGHLCRIDPQTGRRENVTFCPGFLRGLAFVEHFAVVALSLPRGGRFQGLELDDQLARRRVAPWCGLVVIDTRNGDVVEWLRLAEQFGELFDVAVVPATRCAVAIAPNNPVLHDAITFEPEFAPLVRGPDRPRPAPAD
jgi:uncharacterized protein (TIGR03032 family)